MLQFGCRIGFSRWLGLSTDASQFSTEEVDCYAALASAKLELYFANGRCKSHAEYLEGSNKDYCGLDLVVFALENWVRVSRVISPFFFILVIYAEKNSLRE